MFVCMYTCTCMYIYVGMCMYFYACVCTYVYLIYRIVSIYLNNSLNRLGCPWSCKKRGHYNISDITLEKSNIDEEYVFLYLCNKLYMYVTMYVELHMYVCTLYMLYARMYVCMYV